MPKQNIAYWYYVKSARPVGGGKTKGRVGGATPSYAQLSEHLGSATHESDNADALFHPQKAKMVMNAAQHLSQHDRQT